MITKEFLIGIGGTSPIAQGLSVEEYTWDAIYVAEAGTLGGVTGHVYDVETGDAIEGVLVSFQLQSDQTDSEGHYELAEIPVGSQTFTFVKGGYKVAQRDATIVADDWITLDLDLTPGEGPEPPPEPPNLLWLWLLLGASGAAIVGIRTKKLLDKDKRS